MEQSIDITSQIWGFDNLHYLKDEAGVQAAILPPTPLESLGDKEFCHELGVRFPYLAGAMANGIASEELVEAMAGDGMLAFFGAAGLPVKRVESAVVRLKKNLGHRSFGVNLIHSPAEPQWEWGVVDILHKYGVNIVEASAYMNVTLPLIYYRVKGVHRNSQGQVVAPNKIIAKVSRVEVATKFFSPPPIDILRRLYEDGYISASEASLAQEIPLAQYVTAEADSGGHTDNRSAVTLFPILKSLRDRQQSLYDFNPPLRLGMAGGISTPSSVASAFSMGAAYVMGGSIHQACVESGTSDKVRTLLNQVDQADVVMAPAADMFEMGVQVQVVKRGTMFPMRARKLYELYKTYPSIEAIPPKDISLIETQMFRCSVDEVWQETQEYFRQRDPEVLDRCEGRPKQKMALIFRWYLGHGSQWANSGEEGREMDYQIWCGPSMGAFNRWTEGSFLANPKERKITLVALNLLLGALAINRLQILRSQGYKSSRWEAIIAAPMNRQTIDKILQEG